MIKTSGKMNKKVMQEYLQVKNYNILIPVGEVYKIVEIYGENKILINAKIIVDI